MAFIKCPKCGQTALSIASVCPKCGHLLMQHAPPQGSDSTLIQCPRCDKFIDRGTQRCEFCAFPVLFWRRARWVALGVLAVAVITASIVGVWALRRSPAAPFAAAPPAARTPPPPTPSTPPEEATTAPAVPADSVVADSLPVTAAPIVVRTPPVPDTAVTAPAPVPPPATVPTEDRWVVTWANLREGPGLDYPVVRILQPGTRIRAAAPSRGFSAVYGSAGLEGYVAVSLLSERALPQDSLARIMQP